MGQLGGKSPPFSRVSLWKHDCLNLCVLSRLLALFVVLLCWTAQAQQPTDPPELSPPASAPLPAAPDSRKDGPPTNASVPLTLPEALALAEKNSPRLHAANARTARATAAILTSKAYTNPQVESFGGRQESRDPTVPGLAGAIQHYAAYQTMEIPGERRARKRVAELGQTSSEFSLANERLVVVADVERAFYDVLRRKQEIIHAQENLSLVEDLRRRVEVEVRVGEKGRLELTRAEAELARARFMVRSAQIRLANSIAVLRVTIAAPADMNLDPQGTLEPETQLEPLPQLREEILRTHPAMQQARTDVQGAEAGLQYQRSLRVPRPVFYGEYERYPDVSYWRAGVTIPIPLWDRKRGPIQEAAASVRESTATRDERQLEIISALERAYEQYQLADQQVTSLQAGSMREAESAVEAALSAYHFGERGIVEVLDAQRVLQSVRSDLLDAQYARQSALTDLEELGAITPGGRP